MAFSHGQKVVFTEGATGNEYPAEIVGPILRIEGRKGGMTVRAGKAILGCTIERRDADGRNKPVTIEGKGIITSETSRGVVEREAYTLRVNYGDERYADITGVSTRENNIVQYKKSFFTPVAETEAPKPAKESKADEKKDTKPAKESKADEKKEG